MIAVHYSTSNGGHDHVSIKARSEQHASVTGNASIERSDHIAGERCFRSLRDDDALSNEGFDLIVTSTFDLQRYLRHYEQTIE